MAAERSVQHDASPVFHAPRPSPSDDHHGRGTGTRGDGGMSVTATSSPADMTTASRNADLTAIRRTARVAARDGRACGKCGRQLDPAEPVWLVPIGIGYRITGTFGRWRAPVCRECAPLSWLHLPSVSCAGCGRGVVYRRLDSRLLRPACSDRCRWKDRNRRRSEQLAADRIRDCAVCNERFHPAKAGALTCSPACRQKAYRQRLKGSTS
jgi:endogenous inhibitor of DNA gyrase (YacG/DUF329 family)